MYTHNVAADQRARNFFVTLTGDTNLYFQSIHTFQGNLEELQERFRTQFSMMGYTKQLFLCMETFLLR